MLEWPIQFGSSDRGNAEIVVHLRYPSGHQCEIITMMLSKDFGESVSWQCFAQFFQENSPPRAYLFVPFRHDRQRKRRIGAVEGSGSRKYTLSSTLVGMPRVRRGKKRTRRYFSPTDRRRAHTLAYLPAAIFLQRARIHTHTCLQGRTQRTRPTCVRAHRWWTQGREALEREREKEKERVRGAG